MSISDPSRTMRERRELIDGQLDEQYAELRDDLRRRVGAVLRERFPGIRSDVVDELAAHAVTVLESVPHGDPLREAYKTLRIASEAYLERLDADPDGEQTRFALRNLREAAIGAQIRPAG